MIKNPFFLIVILLAISLVGANEDKNINITFVGYDGQIPIFRSSKCSEDDECFPDSVIYNYIDDRLIKTDVVAPSGTKLVIVKNGVYVFREYTDNQTARYYLKRKGRETIACLDISPIRHWEHMQTMNDEFIFIRGKEYNNGSTIFRFNYRTQAKTDTFQLDQYCSRLLDADNNYLYYVDYTPHEAGCDGSLYRMNIKTQVSNVVVWNTENITETMALVTPLNLLYVHGKVVDYNKKLSAVSPDKSLRYNGVGVFYSYEHKGFVVSDRKMDINKWRILRLEDVRKWRPYSASDGGANGPWAVPLIRQCENNRCAIGVERVYREQTGCTNFSSLSGNQMFDYLVKLSKEPQPTFKEVGIEETYTLVDKGHIVIVAHKDPKEHGHVTLIVPGRSKYKKFWQKDLKTPTCYSCENIYLPFVMDTGPEKPIEKQLISESYEPRRQKDVKFWVYIGVGCKE